LAGGVIRTAASEIKLSGRQTMGVRLVYLGDGNSLVAIARNAEAIDNTLGVDGDLDMDAEADVEDGLGGPAEADVEAELAGDGDGDVADVFDIDESEAGDPEDGGDSE